MGVKKRYDKFVENFFKGSRDINRDIKSQDYNDAESLELNESQLPIDRNVSNLTKDDSIGMEPNGSNRNQMEDVLNEDVSAKSFEKPSSEKDLRDNVVLALKEVYDPEIPVNVYDLGLIYSIDISHDNIASIDMTLTSPNCPVAGSLPGEVETAARSVIGVEEAVVNLVWDPPWDMDQMDEAAKLQLGLI